MWVHRSELWLRFYGVCHNFPVMLSGNVGSSAHDTGKKKNLLKKLFLWVLIIMKMLDMMESVWVGETFLAFFTALSSTTQHSKKQLVQKK